MKWRDKAPGKSQGGQAMVEAAVVMPLLVLMLFSVVYFGQAFQDYSNAVIAARFKVWKEARGESVTDNSVAEKFFPDHKSNMSYVSGSVDFSEMFEDIQSPIGFLFTVLDWITDTEIGTVTYKLQPMDVDTARIGFGTMNTSINVKGYHCVDMDTWPEDSWTGYGIKFGTWAYAYSKRNQTGGNDGDQDGNNDENTDVGDDGIEIDIIPGIPITIPP